MKSSNLLQRVVAAQNAGSPHRTGVQSFYSQPFTRVFYMHLKDLISHAKCVSSLAVSFFNTGDKDEAAKCLVLLAVEIQKSIKAGITFVRYTEEEPDSTSH